MTHVSSSYMHIGHYEVCAVYFILLEQKFAAFCGLYCSRHKAVMDLTLMSSLQLSINATINQD